MALEIGKLSAVAWLGARHAASRWLKGAIVTLVGTLMGLNAVGAYGFLSKAHLDHSVAGEVAIDAKAADVEARRQVAEASVADADNRIRQVDSIIAEATKRGRTKDAVALIDRETTLRHSLVAERLTAANALAAVQVEAAGIASERNELAADSGPVHYLATILGVADDTAVRWFIAAVALLLDPLAIVLLLAANAPD